MNIIKFYCLSGILLLLYSIHSSLSLDASWNYAYHGPNVWGDIYPTCYGTSQSPINIQTTCTDYVRSSPFQLSPGYDQIQDFVAKRKGESSISVTQSDPNTYPLFLDGGDLGGIFQFVNFHLHWGSNYKTGSEHQLNGQSYAAEIHFVHRNATLNKYSVLGIFLQSIKRTQKRKKRNVTMKQASTDSPILIDSWHSYAAAVRQLDAIDSSVILRFKLLDLMKTDLNNFYRYNGSLTTPPCTENVIWNVFQQPIILSDIVVNTFRNLCTQNFRPVQPLYNRIVLRSF